MESRINNDERDNEKWRGLREREKKIRNEYERKVFQKNCDNTRTKNYLTKGWNRKTEIKGGNTLERKWIKKKKIKNIKGKRKKRKKKRI